jgi:hypothetical protein
MAVMFFAAHMNLMAYVNGDPVAGNPGSALWSVSLKRNREFNV